MINLILFPLAIGWLLLSTLFTFLSYQLFAELILIRFQEYQYLYYGILSFIIFVICFPLKRFQFWNTLIHELAHALLAVLTLAKPHEMFVSGIAKQKELGHVAYTYKPSHLMNFIRAHLISLAPYFFPLITFCLTLGYFIFKSSIDHSSFQILYFSIGFSYCYHLIINFNDARPHQTDFNSLGYCYGMTFVIFMQSCFLLLLILALTSHHRGYLYFVMLLLDVLF